jgi:hypothetical protein
MLVYAIFNKNINFVGMKDTANTYTSRLDSQKMENSLRNTTTF